MREKKEKAHECFEHFFVVQAWPVKSSKVCFSGWKILISVKEGRNLGGFPVCIVWFDFVEDSKELGNSHRSKVKVFTLFRVLLPKSSNLNKE